MILIGLIIVFFAGSGLSARYGFRDEETIPPNIRKEVQEQKGRVFGAKDVEEPASLFQVTYYYERDSAGSHISYRLPYLELLDAGGPIEAIDFIGKTPFRYYFPRSPSM